MTISEQPIARIRSLDIVRGMVMVLMVLDHVRDFFTNTDINPTDLAHTTGWLFFTRWITHYCAPVFIFLAGASAFLFGIKANSKKALFVFLFTRGVWIIVLEHTLVRFGWFFNFDYSLIIGQVIWAIGCSMILLSFLIFLPSKIVGVFGLVIILCHNMLDQYSAAMFGGMYWLWILGHEPGLIKINAAINFYVAYPILPWLGVMAAGYGMGHVFLAKDIGRNILRLSGMVLCGVFVGIRLLNGYGDPHLWTRHADILFTIFSFVNCTKYPPSLLYLCMTLGPAFILLSYTEQWKGWFADFFALIGKVPMFYYLLHLIIIHSLAILSVWLQGGEVGYLFSNTPPWATPRIYGFGLPGVYIMWFLVVGILYPLCSWFADIKKQHKTWWWLSYI